MTSINRDFRPIFWIFALVAVLLTGDEASDAEAVDVDTNPSVLPPSNNISLPFMAGFDCSFEEGISQPASGGTFCGWTQSSEDSYKWILGKGDVTGNVAGPVSGDYSPNRDGYFAYIDAPGGVPNAKARLFSPLVNKSAPYCIRFYYHANGLGMGRINLYYVDKGQTFGDYEPPFSVGDQSYGDQWIGASYTPPNPYQEKQFILEAVRGSYPTSFLAVDQVTVTDGACRPVGACDFNKDWCLYNPAVSSDNSWQLRRPASELANQQAIASRKSLDRSLYILRSEVIQPKPSACLRVQYNMVIAKGISSLSFWTIQYPANSHGTMAPNRTLIWRLEVQPGGGSPDARSPLTTTSPFQVSIEAEFGTVREMLSEEVTVDDIQLTFGTCAYSPEQANPNYVEPTGPALTNAPSIIVETIQPSPAAPTTSAGLKNYSCSFDDSTFCGWIPTSSESGTLHWSLNTGVTFTTDSGTPQTDVSGTGYFVHLDVRSQNDPLIGLMESPPIDYPSVLGENTDYYVLGFWYMMHGSGVDKLEVHVRNESEQISVTSLLWKTADDQGQLWKPTHVIIPVDNAPVHVVFAGYRLAGSTGGLIAVDEVMMTPGAGAEQFDKDICDFEFDTPPYCGYTEQTAGFIDWLWRSGQDTIEQNDTGPTIDKSENSERGHFMAFSGKDFVKHQTARLITAVQPPTSEGCLKFYYYKRVNAFPGTLSVALMRRNTLTESLWTDGDIIGGDFWQPVFISIQSPKDPWQMHFVAEVIDTNQPIIAFDHVEMRNGSCRSNVLACDFDEGSMCEWRNDVVGNHSDWVITTGASLDPLTGPNADEAGLVTGGYLLFKARNAPVGGVARLISTPYKNPEQSLLCLEWWYHMYGTDVGDLTVLQRNLTEDVDLPVWKLSGQTAQRQWFNGRVALKGDHPYQIIFEASRLHDGIHGDIAIDFVDQYFTSTCLVAPAEADYVSIFPPTKATTLATTARTPGALACDFETGDVCSWEIIDSTSFSWRYVKAGAVYPITGGPAVDHTYQESRGHYILASSDIYDVNKTARFESSSITDGLHRCLTFYFHAYGPGVGSLRVLSNIRTVQNESLLSEQVLWSKHTTDDGSVWQMGQVDLAVDGNATRVVFEAVAGVGKGDIALDDISTAYDVCHPDDNYCSFEAGPCNFVNVSIGETVMLSWEVVSPSSEPQVPGTPAEDVTLGTDQGHFLMAYGAAPVTAVAITKTSLYTATFKDRCFQFYYPSEPNVVLNTTGSNGASVWRVFNFGIMSLAEFAVQFEAELGSGTGVAIDEVKVTEGPCKHLLDCSFGSESSCLWTQPTDADSDDFDWTMISPSTLGAYGPAVDHTTGTSQGWMAYVSDTAIATSSRKAWLVSPVIPVGHYVCLSFWYYLSPANTHQLSPLELRALTVKQLPDQIQNTAWQINQNSAPAQGQWMQGQFGRYRQWPVQMVLEATLPGHFNQYIALDDLKVTGDDCDIQPEQADPDYVPTTPRPPDPEDFEFNCNFDDGSSCVFESWSDETSPVCNWTVRSGPAAYPTSGPSSDHTLQNAEGGYLYYQSSKCQDSSLSSVGLISKNLIGENSQEAAQCLQFWYHMYGAPNSLIVSVNFTDDSSPRLEFLRQGNQGNRWLPAVVTIDNPAKQGYSIVFEAAVGASHLGDIALDDIEVKDGVCSALVGHCDFESRDFCKFHLVIQSKDYQWASARVAILDPDRFPDNFDHTFMTSEGHVAFVSGVNVSEGTSTYMVSPTQQRFRVSFWNDQCITFWYQVPVYPNGGKLKVYLLRDAVENHDFSRPVWSVGDGFQTSWEYGTVPVTMYENYRFAFEAVNGVDSLFVLDDIQLIEDSCPKPLSCDFEGDDGMCGWTNVMQDEFNWIVIQGTSATSGGESAEPTIDHTLATSKGHYIYIDNEHTNLNIDIVSDTARLTSQRVQMAQANRTDWCFSFWYHMYSDSRSNASLELVLVEAGQKETSLLVINKPQRNLWLQQIVPLTYANNGFRLSFHGKVHGAQGKSYIALDDFHGENQNCSLWDIPATFACAGGEIMDFTKVCNQVDDCPDGTDEQNCGNCTFETGYDLCGYVIFNNDAFAWEQQFIALSINSSKRSTVDGNLTRAFLFANFTNGHLRSSTFLDGPWLHETSATCQVTFWYHMDSNHTTDPGALILTLQLDDTETTLAILDRNVLVSAAAGSTWQQHVTDIGRMSGEFRLIFRARKGMSNDGYIALDEISMDSCGFPTAKPLGACLPIEWQCPQTHVCISQDQRCDFTDDCGQGEDETGCNVTSPIRCDFDTDLCNWYADPGDTLMWVRTSGGTATAYSGPLRDHTTGLKNGGFVYFPSSTKPQDTDKTAVLFSPFFESRSLGDMCILRFYYHMYGTTMGDLGVYVISYLNAVPVKTILVWSQNGTNQGDTWQRTTVQLFSSTPFSTVFQARTGGRSSDIAIDDVSFSQSCLLFDSATWTVAPELPTMSPVTTAMTATVVTVLPTVTFLPSTVRITTVSTMPPTTEPIPAPTSRVTTTTSTATTWPTTVTISGQLTAVPTAPTTATSHALPETARTTITDASTAMPTVPTTSSPDEGLGGGAVAGIVIGALVSIGLAGALVYQLALKRRLRKSGHERTGSQLTHNMYKRFGTTGETEESSGNRNILSDMYADDL